MVSLWGSKNGEEQGDGDGRASPDVDSSRQPSRHGDGRNPDERTRLLPPRSDGFLDPDDPAVSTCTRYFAPADKSLHRFRPTIYGPSEPYATFPSSA